MRVAILVADGFEQVELIQPRKALEKGGMTMRSGLCLAVAMTALVAFGRSAFAAGDADKGKAAFAKCAICHQAGLGAKPWVGPELNGIVGRNAASVANYTIFCRNEEARRLRLGLDREKYRQVDRRSQGDDFGFPDGFGVPRNS